MSLGKNPAHLSMVGGKSPRQQMWEVIRANREEFTVYRVARRSNQHDKTVEKYVACLRLGGYVEAIRGFKRGEEVVFQLVRDNGVEAPNLNADGKPSSRVTPPRRSGGRCESSAHRPRNRSPHRWRPRARPCRPAPFSATSSTSKTPDT
ncbi:hypothetical protein AM469_002186 [Pseudomonas aeruginosa]|nr:hypothetical protein AM469_002186 [Pseudomonas aeruginosa]